MKKLFFIALAAVSLMMTSCETTCLTLSPSEATIRVGETITLQPGFRGDGIDINSIKIIMFDDGIVSCDRYYKVEGLKAGRTRVGIGVPNDINDLSKGYLYEVYSTITVIGDN